jgi:hypothetical protein
MMESPSYQRLQQVDARLFSPQHVLECIAARVLGRNERTGIAAPSGPIEQIVAEIWSHLLGCSPIGATDGFFELGGHSLLMVRVVSLLSARLGIVPDIDRFFTAPTVRGQAAVVRDALEKKVGPDVVRQLLEQAESIAAAAHDDDAGGFDSPPQDDPEERSERIAESPAVAKRAVRVELAVEPEASAALVARLRELAGRAAEGASGARISTVAILHCDRPAAVDRALQSYLADLDKGVRVLVIDDSRSTGAASAARSVVERAGVRHSHNVAYWGRGSRRRLGDALVARGMSPSIVDFALFGPTCGGPFNTEGASRNALLLATTGEAVYCTDDDVVGRLMAPLQPKPGLELTSRFDPAHYEFFVEEAAAFGADRAASANLVATHEQLLGRDLREISSLPVTVGPALDRDLAERLARGGRVIVTSMGFSGDCGWGSPSTYVVAPFRPEVFADLTHSETAYARQLTSRQMRRVVVRPTICDASWFMSYAFGLDNRRLLPPVFPVQRGTDIIFARMLYAVVQDACFGHVPLAVTHEPTEPRAFNQGEVFRSASGFDLYELILACLDGFQAPQGDDPQRLLALGRHLEMIGTLDPPDFERVISSQMERSRLRLIEQLERRLEERGGAPSFWADDVRRYIELVEARLGQGDPWVPLDLLARSERSEVEAAALARDLVASYGALVAAWPDMLQAARELRRSEIVAEKCCDGAP